MSKYGDLLRSPPPQPIDSWQPSPEVGLKAAHRFTSHTMYPAMTAEMPVRRLEWRTVESVSGFGNGFVR